MDKTLSNVIFSRYRESYTATVADLLFYLLNSKIDDTNNGSIISSLQNRICRCINGQPDCSDPPSPYEVSVFPGQSVGVSLVSVAREIDQYQHQSLLNTFLMKEPALQSCKLHKNHPLHVQTFITPFSQENRLENLNYMLMDHVQ